MLFLDLQKRLKTLIRARVECGDITGSELARQAGFQQAHISNFLNGRRGLSVEATDQVLQVLSLDVRDLLDLAPPVKGISARADDYEDVPLIGCDAAMLSDFARGEVKQELKFKRSFLQRLRAEKATERQHWVRYVLVKTDADSGRAMYPRLLPGAMLLIDRHYCSLKPYRQQDRNMYLVRKGHQCMVRYVEMQDSHLWLRPENQEFPLDYISLQSGRKISDCVVGRVAHISIEI